MCKTVSAGVEYPGVSFAGLLTGIQARAQRPEYARLLSDCEILYCDTRLQLVTGVTHDAVLHMTGQSLPVLVRDGWAYIMQVWASYRITLHTYNKAALHLLPGLPIAI